MANPQVEDGHTDIANEIAEKFATINLSPYEWRMLWAVLRKTYGWHKTLDFISISQLEAITGLDRRNVSRAKRSLTEKNILVSDGYLIGLNKDYETWSVSSSETTNIVYRDTRPKWFPPPGYHYKTSRETLCGYCCQETENTNRHHILPKSLGGKDINENMATVCLFCHSKLHTELEEYFRVNPDDRQGCYRHFVSLLSSIQTTFLSSYKTTLLSSAKTTTKERKETLKKDTKERDATYSASFDIFWSNYPDRNGKKVGKPQTFKYYCLLKIDELPSCNQAAKNYAESERVRDGIGIKDPERFLLSGRGKDKIEYWREWVEPERKQKEDHSSVYYN